MFQPGEVAHLPENHDRELARAYYRRHIRSMIQSERRGDFYSGVMSRRQMVTWALDRLKWLNCAPEGAYFIIAPLQGKDGRSCQLNNSENLGPSKALRAARIRHGLNPFSGELGRRAA